MRYRALCVIVCLTLVAASHASTSELLPHHPPGAVEILVEGRRNADITIPRAGMYRRTRDGNTQFV